MFCVRVQRFSGTIAGIPRCTISSAGINVYCPPADTTVCCVSGFNPLCSPVLLPVPLWTLLLLVPLCTVFLLVPLCTVLLLVPLCNLLLLVPQCIVLLLILLSTMFLLVPLCTVLLLVLLSNVFLLVGTILYHVPAITTLYRAPCSWYHYVLCSC